MGTSGLRKCCGCGVWFKPDARNSYHQRFCSAPGCRAASKRTSQRKWSRENRNYFRGEMHVERVRVWRRKHPGYWKAKEGAASRGPPDALQDLLSSQGFGNKDVKVFRNCLSAEISRPLQDVLTAQQHALVGLTSMITGEALQDDIARVLTTCYERGQRIGGMVPWMQPQEVKHERTRADCSAAAAAGSPAVQLGRSPVDP